EEEWRIPIGTHPDQAKASASMSGVGLFGNCLVSCGFLREQIVLNRIESEHLANAGETAPVNRNRAEFLQQTAMLRRGITLVRLEIVSGMNGVELGHQRITRG